MMSRNALGLVLLLAACDGRAVAVSDDAPPGSGAPLDGSAIPAGGFCSGATPRAQVDGQEIAVHQVTAQLSDLVVEHQTRFAFAIEGQHNAISLHIIGPAEPAAGVYDLAHLPADWWIDLYAFCGNETGSCKGGKAFCSLSSSCRACLQGSLAVGKDRSVTLCLTAPAPTPICQSGCFERSILRSTALYSGLVQPKGS